MTPNEIEQIGKRACEAMTRFTEVWMSLHDLDVAALAPRKRAIYERRVRDGYTFSDAFAAAIRRTHADHQP